MVLNGSGHLTVGGLAKALGIAEPSASILVDKLEKQGLAVCEVDPADRRRTPEVVSAAGRELVSRLRSIRDVRLSAWLSELGDDGLDALLRVLTALLRVADKPRQCALPEQAR